MKFLPILLVASVLMAVVAASINFEEPVINDDIVRKVNSYKGLSWRAKKHTKFAQMSVSEAMGLLGADKPFGTPEDIPAFVSQFNGIPAEFDSATAFPGCVGAIRNQGRCGSCWAFAASEVLADRLCIASHGIVNVTLSPQSLVSCDVARNMGCNGGYPNEAWKYLINTGIPTEECFPYESGVDGYEPSCNKNSCADRSVYKTFQGKTGSLKNLNNVQAIQQEIMTNGPVEGTFMVYRDFMTYSSGVYVRTPGSPLLGGHAVKIVGWGVDKVSGLEYWKVANSWGESWGLGGHFLIRRGSNECGIDRDASCVDARV
eukprot:gene8068-9926_t